MATPPYKGWVQAYAGSGNSETPGGVSGDESYTLATPTGFGVTDVSYAFRYDWTYTPGSDDDLAGFKLWFSNNPTPNWGTAMDVGVAFPGDSANEYQFELPKNLGGFIFCYVQAYGHHGGTTVSSLFLLEIPAELPESVPVIGLNPQAGKIATALEVSPAGQTSHSAMLDGVPIPTVNDFVAGTGIGITVSGGQVEIAAQASGTPIQPDAISGLVSWYDATELVGYADNDPIPTWPDLSSTGNNMTQATSGRQPHYKASGINGLPAVYLDGVSRVGFTGTTSLSNPFSIFYVAQGRSSSGNQRIIQGASNNWLIGPYAGSWQWYSGGFATAVGSVTVGENVIHGVTQASGSGAHFSYKASNNTSNFPVQPSFLIYQTRASPGAPGVFYIGGEGAYDDYPNAYVGEIVVYSRQVTYDEGMGLIAYFKDKWGL